MELANYATLFFAYILPLILIIVFSVTFNKKVDNDLCNLKYYECNPPIGASVVDPLSPFAPTTSTTKANTDTAAANANKAALNALANAKKDQSGVASSLPQPFINIPSTTTTLPTTTAYVEAAIDPSKVKVNCTAGFKQIKDISPDSNSYLNSYKSASIGFMVFIVILAVISGILFYSVVTSTSLESGDELFVKIVFFLGIIINFALLIASAVFAGKGKSTAYEKYTSFTLSFIGFLIGLFMVGSIYVHQGVSIGFGFLSDQEPLGSGLAVLSLVTLLIFIPGSIYFLITQKNNLMKNALSFSLNNAVSDNVSIMIIVVAILNIIMGIMRLLKKDASPVHVVDAMTQFVSCILLIAAVALYYDYKRQCSDVDIKCKPTSVSAYEKDGSLTTINKCQLKSDMNIGSSNVKAMSIACSIIMGLTQIAGIFCYVSGL